MKRLTLIAVLGGLVAGVATLVQAQQSSDPIGGLLQPSPRASPDKPAEKPADETPSPKTAPGLANPVPPQEAADADLGSEPEAPTKPAPAKPIEPMKRPRFAVAVIQALDKVTTETVRFEAPVNHPVRYKSLIFTVNACETTAPDEDQSDAAAHVEIDSQPRNAGQTVSPARQVFRGWMFANAPGLHLFQHPVYDAWLIACKTASPPA